MPQATPRPSWTRLLRRAAGPVAALALAMAPGVVAAQSPSTLDPASPNAAELKRLYDIIFFLGLAVFLLVEGLILYAIVKFRRRPGDPEPRQVHGSAPFEIAWTIAPTVIVLALAVVSYRPLVDAGEVPADALVVEAVGRQWWWEFKYPSADVTTATELVVPVGRPVRVDVESTDVIHSFWAPQLAGKIDAVPGQRDGGFGQNGLWFTAEREGRFEGQCAELCGAQHAGMRFTVVVVGAAAFEQWLAEQSSPAAEPAPGSVEAQGRAIIAEKACQGCHIIDGVEGMVGQNGPDLTHVASRPWLAGGVFENTPENLARWIDHPDDLKPGTVMPDAGLTPDEIRAVAAYLESLR